MENKEALQKCFNFYLENLKELSERYNGKYIAIKDCRVLGAYDTFDIAYMETLKKETSGTFIIQKAENNPAAYTSTYYNNLIRV
jgi:hypothetical protein